MKWIKTQRGGLVNLENVAAIDTEEVHGESRVSWSVKATLVNGSVRTLAARIASEDAATRLVDALAPWIAGPGQLNNLCQHFGEPDRTEVKNMAGEHVAWIPS